MKRVFIAIAAIWLGVLFVGDPALGHDGDPKAKFRTPYQGPGFRLGGGGGGGPGPQGAGQFDSLDIQLLAWMPLPEFGAGIATGNDCWGYVSPSGREYAIFGHEEGTAFIEITDPTNPVIVEQIDGPDSLWRDMKVYQSYAYAVSEAGSGIQVIDLSLIDLGQVTLVTEITTGGTPDTHNVAIDEVSGFLYRCGGGSDDGIRIYSLANPANPVFVGAWNDRYVHDCQVVTYVGGPYDGMQVAFLCGGFNGGWVETGLDVLDVTDKSNIQTLDQVIYADGEYSHQAWLSEDRQYLYLNDELDEQNLGIPTNTKVFDVSNLTNVVEVSEFTNGEGAIGHNLYTAGNLIFEANYSTGLRVFDAFDPTAPVEIAYFDTFPENDGADFDGLWSVYPYFPSGTVIGSDMNRGFFVWHVGQFELGFSYPNGVPDLLDPAGDSFPVQILEQTETYVAGTAKLHYDDGTGYQEVDLVDQGGLLFDAVFPPVPCGTQVQFYLSAEAANGSVLTDPLFAPDSGTYTAGASLGEIVVASDDMESDTGWTVGAPGDDATTGIWVRVDPIGTAAQPELDHTPTGTQCWVTGQGTVGGSLGENDVDGGQTTLVSPTLDASGLFDPAISYWRWYNNQEGGGAGSDIFEVELSANDGGSWTNVEIVGPTGEGTDGGWIFHEVRIADFLTPTATMRVRFIASDEGTGSIVEAAVDDLAVTETACNDCNNNGVDDFTDIAQGTSQDCNENGIPDECDIADGTSEDGNGNGVPDECECPIMFIRGDVNFDLTVGLADVFGLLGYLFQNGPDPIPLESGDVNADGGYNISDGTYLLGFLFANGPPPPAPFPDPGCP